MCKKFKWQIHGEEFVIDVMLLPLGGCDKLISRVDLPIDQQISFHIDGLQIDVKLAVMMFKPKTLAEMYQLSKIQEVANKISDKSLVFSVFCIEWHLEEIHVTWAHLEKKQTRLRTYTKSFKELCSQSVETASQA
ncbi:hypothetical protein Tco_0715784 [Tanacetum coccineum]